MSLPTRGAWIEISLTKVSLESSPSLPTRGAWIEIFTLTALVRMVFESLPTRGAWIEIYETLSFMQL